MNLDTTQARVAPIELAKETVRSAGPKTEEGAPPARVRTAAPGRDREVAEHVDHRHIPGLPAARVRRREGQTFPAMSLRYESVRYCPRSNVHEGNDR